MCTIHIGHHFHHVPFSKKNTTFGDVLCKTQNYPESGLINRLWLWPLDTLASELRAMRHHTDGDSYGTDGNSTAASHVGDMPEELDFKSATSALPSQVQPLTC